MDRPKEAIEQCSNGRTHWSKESPMAKVFAYLDWLEGKHVVDWPKELTRERLEGVSDSCDSSGLHNSAADIRALAAIAPVRKKRVVSIWEEKGANGHPNNIAYHVLSVDAERTSNDHHYMGWRKVAGPIELEE